MLVKIKSRAPYLFSLLKKSKIKEGCSSRNIKEDYSISGMVMIHIDDVYKSTRAVSKNISSKGITKILKRRRSEYMKDYRSGEIGRQQRQGWLENHPAYYSTWRKQHPQYYKNYRQKNRNKYKRYQKEWRKRNREKRRKYMRNYMWRYRRKKCKENSCFESCC